MIIVKYYRQVINLVIWHFWGYIELPRLVICIERALSIRHRSLHLFGSLVFWLVTSEMCIDKPSYLDIAACIQCMCTHPKLIMYTFYKGFGCHKLLF